MPKVPTLIQENINKGVNILIRFGAEKNYTSLFNL
jgi:hypothetical protein